MEEIYFKLRARSLKLQGSFTGRLTFNSPPLMFDPLVLRKGDSKSGGGVGEYKKSLIQISVLFSRQDRVILL